MHRRLNAGKEQLTTETVAQVRLGTPFDEDVAPASAHFSAHEPMPNPMAPINKPIGRDVLSASKELQHAASRRKALSWMGGVVLLVHACVRDHA